MKLTRSCRWYAAVIALVSTLFMQLAVAAYACPQLAAGMDIVQPSLVAAGPVQEMMPGCEMADRAQPALCHAHGQAGKQSLDKPEPPPVQPFVAAGLVIALHPATTVKVAEFLAADIASLARTTAPPLSIRNCCFRI